MKVKTKKINILMVTPFFYPSIFYGGFTTSLFGLSKVLSRLGCKVSVATTDAYNNKRRLSPDDLRGVKYGKLKVYHFSNLSNYLSYKFNGFIPLMYIYFLAKNIKYFDILHLNDYYTFQNIVSLFFCKMYKKPYVLQARGSVLPSVSRGRVFVKKLFIELFGKALLKNASFVVALSEYEKKQYIRAGVAKEYIMVIPNGVDTNTKKVKFSDISNFKNKFGLNDKEFVFMYLGRINRVKGVDILVRAFHKAFKNKKLNNTKLLLVGPDGGYLEYVKKMVVKLRLQDRVIFTGALDGILKIVAYRCANVFILPSRNEPFSNVVLEALSNSTPVLVSSSCGLSSEIDGFVGRKFSSSEALQKLMIKAYNKDKVFDTYKNNGSLFVKNNYNWDKIGQLMIKLYSKILK